MNPTGPWIRPNRAPAPPVDGLTPFEATTRVVVDKSVLLGDEENDNDRIDDIGQNDPWQEYFNKSQRATRAVVKTSNSTTLTPAATDDSQPHEWNIQCDDTY